VCCVTAADERKRHAASERTDIDLESTFVVKFGALWPADRRIGSLQSRPPFMAWS